MSIFLAITFKSKEKKIYEVKKTVLINDSL